MSTLNTRFMVVILPTGSLFKVGIRQTLLSLLEEIFIGKVLLQDKDSIVLSLVNLSPDFHVFKFCGKRNSESISLSDRHRCGPLLDQEFH